MNPISVVPNPTTFIEGRKYVFQKNSPSGLELYSVSQNGRKKGVALYIYYDIKLFMSGLSSNINYRLHTRNIIAERRLLERGLKP